MRGDLHGARRGNRRGAAQSWRMAGSRLGGQSLLDVAAGLAAGERGLARCRHDSSAPPSAEAATSGSAARSRRPKLPERADGERARAIWARQHSTRRPQTAARLTTNARWRKRARGSTATLLLPDAAPRRESPSIASVAATVGLGARACFRNRCRSPDRDSMKVLGPAALLEHADLVFVLLRVRVPAFQVNGLAVRNDFRLETDREGSGHFGSWNLNPGSRPRRFLPESALAAVRQHQRSSESSWPFAIFPDDLRPLDCLTSTGLAIPNHVDGNGARR